VPEAVSPRKAGSDKKRGPNFLGPLFFESIDD